MKTPVTQDNTKEERLSPHFSLREMTRSGTALRYGIDNTPTKEAIDRLRLLCENVLEPLRRRFGRIIVTSGYRSPELNQRVGGAAASQHLRGEAADIYVSDTETAMRYARFLRDNTDFDQLLVEPLGRLGKRWLHVSYTCRHANRHSYRQ